jgi:preprotein translocase subunit SecD
MSLIPSEIGGFLKRALLLLAVLLCVFAVAAALWQRAGRKTYRVVYRLGEPGTRPTAAELDRTVQVLSARLEALRRELKTGSGSVRALPPDRVEVEASLSDDATAFLTWLAMQGKAEFRLLHPEDDVLERAGAEALPPEYEVKTYTERRYILTRLGDLKTVENRYAVLREPSLVVHGFQGASIATTGAARSVVLTFRFTDEDAPAFAALTALHAGRKMAMLVDGEMFFPPRQIESAVSSGSVQAQGFFYIPPVRRLVEMLSAGSLPRPLAEVSRTVE